MNAKCANHITKIYSVLTNGETDLPLTPIRYGSGVNPGNHVYGQDGYGNHYIDGKPAHIEVRIIESKDR